MKKIGRNDPCHCGSGKKYKNCHQQIDTQTGTVNKNMIIGGLALLVILFAIGMYFKMQPANNPAPGPAPEGKVWSSEHGHWHNAE